MRLKGRVEALEAVNRGWTPWHRIIVPAGDTVEGATERYEAEHGPIGDDNRMIIRVVQPAPRETVAGI